MTIRTGNIAADLQDYILGIGVPEHPALQNLRARTQDHRLAKMAIAPEQAQILTWLAQLIGAKYYLEVGVFTGYSSTAMALTLPDDAKIVACDINVTFTDIAKTAWQDAQVAHKIDLKLQPALITLQELLTAGFQNYFDMALIDADKEPTPEYFEACLPLVRSGGIIAIDNILLNGRVFQDNLSNPPPSIAILQAFNAKLPQDSRITPITLPIGDGITLLLKR